MTEVLFLHSPNLHEAHRRFAESIGANFEDAYYDELRPLIGVVALEALGLIAGRTGELKKTRPYGLLL